MSCVSCGSRPVSRVSTRTLSFTRAAMSISTDDSAWKLATMTSRGNAPYAHRSTASGFAPELTSGGTVAPIADREYRLETLGDPDRSLDRRALEHGHRTDPLTHCGLHRRQVSQEPAGHHDRAIDGQPRTHLLHQRCQSVARASDDSSCVLICAGTVEHHARERRPPARLAVALQLPRELEHL